VKVVVDKKQTEFLERDFWSAAWNASVQRASVYKKNLSEEERRHFKKQVFRFINDDLMPFYTKKCSEEQHYENIKRLVVFGTECGREILEGNIYKYGIAQKLLNLLLKYYWCIGRVSEPPHCPIDSIILNKLGLNEIKWTKMVQKSEYERVIEKIKMKLTQEEPTIARWELIHYMDANEPIADLPLTPPARPSAKPPARGTPAPPD
jgi:hypothetical protein